MLLVTGGCGFIGSAFVLEWLRQSAEPLLNLDLLTYAGHRANVRAAEGHAGYRFVRGDIGDTELVTRLLAEHRPRSIVHFAAESHVDRSITGPLAFVNTNVVGTVKLLEAALGYWNSLTPSEAAAFRFVNVSTDEVYGSLGVGDAAFTEEHRFLPNNPYSASKAAEDHMVRAWHHTFQLPALTTHCSNNYGPRQFPEKLIPVTIDNALNGLPLPVYGDGLQVRDWLYVNDHCAALRAVLERGAPGETYNIGGRAERTNLGVVQSICAVLDELRPLPGGSSYAAQITHVSDRRGHDRRYAIDDTKIARQLGWKPAVAFEDGLRQTVQWYLDNGDWVMAVTGGDGDGDE
jgi:dTDP-glucose 4,6-dehydratase